MNQRKTAQRTPIRLALLAAIAIVVALPATPRTGKAQGGTCIDDVTGRTNNCTANDVRISELRNSEDTACTAGSLVDLNLTARLVATANERYDLGTFVALDGGDARTGTCQQDYLPPPLSAGGTCSVSGETCHWDVDCPTGEACTGGYDPLSGAGPFFNAEAEEDSDDLCGDIEQAVETFYDLVTVTVPCEDVNGDGYLDIGTCLSWDDQKTTTCVDVSGAVPNNPAKCRCEMTTVGNVVVRGSIQVAMVAEPAGLPEPGGDVELTFTVTNPSSATITVESLVDSIYGDLTQYAGSTCTVPQTLAPAASYTCAITAPVSGPLGAHEDTVTAAGTDQNQDPVSDTAVAQVTITDTLPTIVLTKTVDPASLPEPGGMVTYTVQVKNTSGSGDAVTLTGLSDSLHGNLTDIANPSTSRSTCSLVRIEPGKVYACTFRAELTGVGGSALTDTVTAIGADEEANPAQASDDAAVAILPGLLLDVTKSVTPECVTAAGDVAVYTVAVTNTNPITVVLTAFSDTVHGDLTDPANPKITESTCALATIAPAQSFTCTFKAAVVFGEGSSSMTDTVTVQATDAAGKTAMDSDNATVDLCIQPPETGVGFPAGSLAAGLAALGIALAGVGAWLRRRAR